MTTNIMDGFAKCAVVALSSDSAHTSDFSMSKARPFICQPMRISVAWRVHACCTPGICFSVRRQCYTVWKSVLFNCRALASLPQNMKTIWRQLQLAVDQTSVKCVSLVCSHSQGFATLHLLKRALLIVTAYWCVHCVCANNIIKQYVQVIESVGQVREIGKIDP